MDKINKILEKLIESTECGALEWSPRNTTFNSESRHHYHTKSVDEKTTFEIEISLTEKLDSIGYRNSLWIKNEFFTDGRKHVSSNELTKKLEDLVYEKYIKPSLIVKQEDEILDEILTNIGDRSYVRDKNLSQILEDESNSDGFLKKLFI
jgi:hypothetical protein